MNTHGLLSYARRLLHAFADAGEPSATGLELFMGPNGGLMWTDSVQVDRSEPYAGDVFDHVIWNGYQFPGHWSWIYVARNDPSLDGTHIWQWMAHQPR